MNHERFIDLCRQKVWEYEQGKTDPLLEDVFVVWSCKTLQNSKALLSAKPSGALYYEFTMNGNAQEIYMDAYKKVENIALNYEGDLVERVKR